MSVINSISPTIRNDVIKALIIICKYVGRYEEFKAAMKAYGIKLTQPSALDCFLRIYNNNNTQLDAWLAQVKPVLSDSQNLLLRFAKLTGLRKQEAINSFNLVIKLAKVNRLGDYLNLELNALEHFRYKALFIRNTKNAYFSFLPEGFLEQMIKSEPVAYTGIVKRLGRRNISCRINELRDSFGTFFVKHGIIREEIDLVQGRVSASIFARCYFSPSISELRCRMLKGLAEMETTKQLD